MQDTFVKAWRHLDAFQNRHDGAEKAWLLRIAINTCRDYQRSMWFKKVELPGEMEKLPPALISVAPRKQELFLDVLSTGEIPPGAPLALLSSDDPAGYGGRYWGLRPHPFIPD